MKNLTKEKAIELHREMWRRISEMSNKEFEDKSLKLIKEKVILDMDYDPKEIILSCFCCEYAGGPNCNKCPISWKDEKCYYESSEYYIFIGRLKNKKYKKARKIAKKISELPERKGE